MTKDDAKKLEALGFKVGSDGWVSCEKCMAKLQSERGHGRWQVYGTRLTARAENFFLDHARSHVGEP